MILGMPVTPMVMLIGGIIVLGLTLFEVLLGLRFIKLGRQHRTVHRRVAFAIVAVAVVHGFLGVLLVTGARLG